MELNTLDVSGAAGHLDTASIVRRDESEPLSEDFDGLWVANPCVVIHLVSKPGQEDY